MKRFIPLIVFFLFSSLIHGQIEDFSLTDVNGNSYNLYTELQKGKTVVIDFFGIQCGTCQTDMAILNDLWQQHGGQNGDLWVWAYETIGGSASDVTSFVNTYGGDFPAFQLNPADSLMELFQVSYIPSYYVICPTGHTKPCSIESLPNYIEACSELGAGQPESYLDEIIAVWRNSSNKLNVRFTNQKAGYMKIEVFDLLGNQIKRKEINCSAGIHQEQLNIDAIKSGFYLVRVSNRKGYYKARKIMI